MIEDVEKPKRRKKWRIVLPVAVAAVLAATQAAVEAGLIPPLVAGTLRVVVGVVVPPEPSGL